MSTTPDDTRLSEAVVTAQGGRKEPARPPIFKRIASSEAILAVGGFALASYYRLVRWTNRFVRIPDASFFEPFDRGPVIIAMWHGEHFLLPFFARRKHEAHVMVGLHRDAEIAARFAMHLGLKTVRGSGDHGKEFGRKKAVQAFTTMLRLLKRGEHVAMTADVPKVARVVGLGIVTLAKHSGCPIVPLGMGTSRRRRLSNWDRTCISLPFGRMVLARGEPIQVDRDADDAALEAARRTVEQRLNEADAHAYAVADSERKP